MEVVVEVRGQNRWAGRGSEPDDAALAERTLLGIVVRVGALEPGVVLPARLIGRRREAARGVPTLRGLGELRHAAIGGIDDERGALAPVDDRIARARIEPEIVVPADVAVRAWRAVAAFGRSGAVGINRRIRFRVAIGDLVLQLLRVLVAEDERLPGTPLDGRQRRQIVSALQIGMAVGGAWRRARRRRLRPARCLRRRARRGQRDHGRHGDPTDDRRQESLAHARPLVVKGRHVGRPLHVTVL